MVQHSEEDIKEQRKSVKKLEVEVSKGKQWLEAGWKVYNPTDEGFHTWQREQKTTERKICESERSLLAEKITLTRMQIDNASSMGIYKKKNTELSTLQREYERKTCE